MVRETWENMGPFLSRQGFSWVDGITGTMRALQLWQLNLSGQEGIGTDPLIAGSRNMDLLLTRAMTTFCLAMD